MSAAIRKLPGATKAFLAPRLATIAHYGKVELMPPSPTEIPEAIAHAGRLVKSGVSGKWLRLPVKDVVVNMCITAEVVCWFFIGECIGKGSFVGYQV